MSYQWPIDHRMDYRATKRLPTLARNFLSTAQREMGVTVFMVASYRNAEGAVQFLCMLTSLNLVNCLRMYVFYRFETEGSTFTKEKSNL